MGFYQRTISYEWNSLIHKLILNKEAKEKVLSLLADTVSTVVGIFLYVTSGY